MRQEQIPRKTEFWWWHSLSRNTLCIARKSDEIRARFFRKMPQAYCAVLPKLNNHTEIGEIRSLFIFRRRAAHEPFSRICGWRSVLSSANIDLSDRDLASVFEIKYAVLLYLVYFMILPRESKLPAFAFLWWEPGACKYKQTIIQANASTRAPGAYLISFRILSCFCQVWCLGLLCCRAIRRRRGCL